MTASEVMVLARSGELRQLSPSIRDDDATLVAFINLGLLEIYKRFALKTDEALVTLTNGKTIYSLDGTDADVSMGTSGDYFYLIAAYEESDNHDDYTTDDKVVPINVEDDIFSINTISYNQVQVPLITEGSTISLIYVTKPTKVTLATLDAELDISDALIEPLLAYIGHRGYKTMGDKGQSEDDIFFLQFEKACNKVRDLGVAIAPDDIAMNTRLKLRGFV
jgi:hypothetical protein